MKTGMKTWTADFKDAAVHDVPLDRSKWDAHRDLVVTLPAEDERTARRLAFEIAGKHLGHPFLGDITTEGQR